MAACDVSFCYRFPCDAAVERSVIKREKEDDLFFLSCCCWCYSAKHLFPFAIYTPFRKASIHNDRQYFTFASQARKEGHLSAPFLSLSDLLATEAKREREKQCECSLVTHAQDDRTSLSLRESTSSHSLMVKVHLRILPSSSVLPFVHFFSRFCGDNKPFAPMSSSATEHKTLLFLETLTVHTQELVLVSNLCSTN